VQKEYRSKTAKSSSESKAALFPREKTYQDVKSQDLPHSASVLDWKFRHDVMKDSDQPEVELKRKIRFPRANDPIWKVVNNELSQDLKYFKRSPNSNDSLKKLDNHVYNYLASKFGTFDPVIPGKKQSERKSRALERIRREKTQLKREWRQLSRENLTESKRGQVVRSQYCRFVRLHNRLRKLHLDTRRKASQVSAEKNFRSNPQVYAAKIFAKDQVKGIPTFSKEAAEEYFTRTYEDKRGPITLYLLLTRYAPIYQQFLFFSIHHLSVN